MTNPFTVLFYGLIFVGVIALIAFLNRKRSAKPETWENENQKSQEPICPNCQKKLEKMPTRKTKCPYCGKYIYFKRIPESKIKKLVTEEEAKKIEQMWDARNQDIKKNEWIGRLGIDEKTFDAFVDEKRRETGKEISLNNAVWILSNKIKGDIFSKYPIDYSRAREICLVQESILNEEGRDTFRVRKEELKMELYKDQATYKSLGLNWPLKIRTMGMESCEECKKLEGKIFSIDEALEKMPLPCPTCKTIFDNEKIGLCRCYYETITK